MAPTDLEATQGSYVRLVLLVWAPVEGADRYEILRARSAADEFTMIGQSNQALYEDTDVTAGRTYWYKVRACSPNGCSEPSEEASGYAASDGPKVPLPPTGVTATDGTHTDRVHISWEAVDGADEYLVHRADEQDAHYGPLASVETTSYDDATAEPGATYWYRVRTCDINGCSTMSSASRGSVAALPPDAPTDLVATNGAYADLVRITWATTAETITYEVHRARTVDGTYSKIGATTSTVFDDTDVAEGETYWYRVRACNAGGCGDFSEADSGYAGTASNGNDAPPAPPG